MRRRVHAISPRFLKTYLDHVVDQVSMSEIARRRRHHRSTIMRRIHVVEDARDDPDQDAAVARAEAVRGHSSALI